MIMNERRGKVWEEEVGEVRIENGERVRMMGKKGREYGGVGLDLRKEDDGRGKYVEV